MDLVGRTWRVGFPGFGVALMGLVLSACSLGHPRIDLADGTTGTIAFRTQTPTPGDFARRNLDAPAAVIWGELRIPRRASGRVPAVVLVHGSSGVGNNMPGWCSELNGMGVATFIVDSFGVASRDWSVAVSLMPAQPGSLSSRGCRTGDGAASVSRAPASSWTRRRARRYPSGRRA